MLKEIGPISTARVVTIGIDASLQEAYGLMAHREIRHLPVVDPTGRIVGIISDRDLKRAMLPDSGLSMEGSTPRFNPRDRVSMYMSWPAKGIDEHTPVAEVVQLMLEEKISSLLIVEGPRSHPTGIVTTDDLLRYLLKILDSADFKRGKLPVRDFFSKFHVQDGTVV